MSHLVSIGLTFNNQTITQFYTTDLWDVNVLKRLNHTIEDDCGNCLACQVGGLAIRYLDCVDVSQLALNILGMMCAHHIYSLDFIIRLVVEEEVGEIEEPIKTRKSRHQLKPSLPPSQSELFNILVRERPTYINLCQYYSVNDLRDVAAEIRTHLGQPDIYPTMWVRRREDLTQILRHVTLAILKAEDTPPV